MSEEKPVEINLESLKNAMMGGGRNNMKNDNQKRKQNQKNGNYSNGNNSNKNNSNKNNSNGKKQNNNFSKQQNGNYNYGNGNYVGAPYNFISFSNQVYEYPKEKKVKHNDTSDELLTGEISYEITAKTPIIVSEGKGEDGAEHFHRNPKGQYSIQGSTMR